MLKAWCGAVQGRAAIEAQCTSLQKWALKLMFVGSRLPGPAFTAVHGARCSPTASWRRVDLPHLPVGIPRRTALSCRLFVSASRSGLITTAPRSASSACFRLEDTTPSSALYLGGTSVCLRAP